MLSNAKNKQPPTINNRSRIRLKSSVCSPKTLVSRRSTLNDLLKRRSPRRRKRIDNHFQLDLSEKQATRSKQLIGGKNKYNYIAVIIKGIVFHSIHDWLYCMSSVQWNWSLVNIHVESQPFRRTLRSRSPNLYWWTWWAKSRPDPARATPWHRRWTGKQRCRRSLGLWWNDTNYRLLSRLNLNYIKKKSIFK